MNQNHSQKISKEDNPKIKFVTTKNGNSAIDENSKIQILNTGHIVYSGINLDELEKIS